MNLKDKLNAINFSVLLFYVLLFLSFFILNIFWENILNEIWVNPIMSKMNRYEFVWVPVFILLIIIYYYKAFSHEKIINEKRIKVLITILLIYLICFFSGKWFYYHPFNCQLLSYSNILLIPIFFECCLIFKIKRQRLNNEGNEPQLEIEEVENVSDSYQRLPMIDNIAEVIKNNFHTTQSFAIGISGTWGSGKTVFIEEIKRVISRDKKVALLLFEPWKNDSPDSIIKSFFDLYKEEVNKYAPNLSPIINRYVLTLLNEESSGVIKFCTQLSELLINGDRTEDLYDDMKEHLKKIAHKTIIFIDDIDRLNAPEIMEVLRLIRNTANFPFLQFIVTYDKEYLIKALEHSGVPKSEQYLEKIFNLEIPLPKFEERIICYELHNRIKETLNSLFNIDKENLIYKDMIYHRCSEESSAIFDYLIPKILENNRDVIRFHNSFNLILRCFQNNSKEIDYRDLFYLELIRYRFPQIYNILRNSPLLLLNVTEEYYSYSQKEEEKPTDKFIHNPLQNYTNSEREIITDLMNLLFDRSSDENSMSRIRNFSKYFMFRLDEKILTQTELLALAEEHDDELLNKSNKYYQDKYPLEFENQLYTTLNSIHLIENSELSIHERNYNLDFSKLYHMICVISRSEYRGLRNEIINATIPYIQSLKAYSIEQFKAILDLLNDIDLKSVGTIKFDMDGFLMSILYRDNLSANLHNEISDRIIEIVKLFLHNSKWKALLSPAINGFLERHNRDKIADNKLVLTTQELKDIQLTYFCSKENKLDEEGFTLFYNCINYIDELTHIVHLRKEALKCMKKAIEETPEAYFAKFIRTGISSDTQYNTVFPEPFYRQIFGSIEEFEIFLNDQPNNPVSIKVKNYWELYKHNDYSPVDFERQGDVNLMIQNNFVNEMAKLKVLKEIDSKLHENGNVATKELVEQFEENDLYIAYRGKIYQRLQKVN